MNYEIIALNKKVFLEILEKECISLAYQERENKIIRVNINHKKLIINFIKELERYNQFMRKTIKKCTNPECWWYNACTGTIKACHIHQEVDLKWDESPNNNSKINRLRKKR